MSWMHFALAWCELLLAVLLWHRAMPAMLAEAQWRAVKIWGLGMALAVYGIGQLEAGLGYSTIPGIRSFADVCLIAYAAARLLHILRHAPPPHWSDAL